MSANSESKRVTPPDEATLPELLSGEADWSSVLIMGPAISGKQSLGVELLATATSAGGQPIAITTADTPEQMRTAYQSVGGEATDNLAVIDCLPGTDDSTGDEWTRAIGSPGDFTGIAMAISDVFGSISDNRRRGARVLVDNLATSLVYTDIEPLYRFLHALIGRVTGSGGAVVATLDTDGTDDADQQALVGLFETVVEVRRVDDASEFRIVGREDVPDTWFRHPSRGDDI